VLCAAYAASPRPGGDGLRRPVPSGGALYPREVYVIPLAVTALEPALYHFHPFESRLSRLRHLDGASLRSALVDATVLDVTAALLVITSVFWRSRCKYGLRGYRFALLEAGHLAQNVVLAAAGLDLPALPVGGFYDRRLDELVGADGLDEASLYAVALGGPR
jgi:SagB-type dehydrogenase family enzyme